MREATTVLQCSHGGKSLHSETAPANPPLSRYINIRCCASVSCPVPLTGPEDNLWQSPLLKAREAGRRRRKGAEAGDERNPRRREPWVWQGSCWKRKVCLSAVTADILRPPPPGSMCRVIRPGRTHWRLSELLLSWQMLPGGDQGERREICSAASPHGFTAAQKRYKEKTTTLSEGPGEERRRERCASLRRSKARWRGTRSEEQPLSRQRAGKRGQKARGGMATTFGSAGGTAPLNLRLISLHLCVSPSQGCVLQSLPVQQKQRGAFARLPLRRLE